MWFAIGASSMFLLCACAAIMLLIVFASEPDLGEPLDEDEDYYYVEQASVLEAVEKPCEDMRVAGAKIGVFDDPKKAAVEIEAFAVAAQGVADAIASADPNRDSQKWQADWEKLSSDLTAYAGNLRDAGGGALFSSIHPAGEMPVMVRMVYSSDANCEVPSVVVAMDPEVDEYNAEAFY